MPKLEHPVWEYFEVKNDGVYCTAKGCKAKLALPKSTTNTARHLRSNHAKLFNEYSGKLASWKTKQPAETRTPSSSKMVSSSDQHQQQLNEDSFKSTVASSPDLF
jgi:hypothetical protein